MIIQGKTRLLLGVVAAASAVASAQANDIVNSDGFESPDYSTTFDGTGSLEGQDGWLTAGGGVSTATVQTTVVASGTQAVRVDRGASSDDFWAVPVVGFPSVGFDQVIVEWDMRVEDSGSTGFGPFFGVQVNDDNGVPLLQAAGFGVDAATGDVLFQAGSTGFLTETGTFATFGEWNNFRIELDYSTDMYSYYFNDGLLGTTSFVDAGVGGFTDADITAIAAAGDATSQAATGTAYFDNFVVSEVPEPGSLALLAMGVGLLVSRRRRD